MKSFSENISLKAEEIKIKLKDLTFEDTLVFPLFTDLHTEDAMSDSSQKLFKAIKILKSKVKFHGVINLGDNFAMLGREFQIENNELKRRINSLLDKLYETCSCPVINVHGNHDAIGTDFFKPDFWNECVKGKYGLENAVYGEGAYYYTDFDDCNTRFVVLSMPHDSDLEAENPTPAWSFGKKQLEWVKSTALNTNRKIIILCHSPFYYEYRGEYGDVMYKIWNGEKLCETHVANLCGWIDDVGEMADIIKNFDVQNPGKLIACLSGHTHADSLYEPFEEADGFKNPLPCVQCVTAGVFRNKYEQTGLGFCMDVMVWTPSQNSLTMLRLGDGEDRKVK